MNSLSFLSLCLQTSLPSFLSSLTSANPLACLYPGYHCLLILGPYALVTPLSPSDSPHSSLNTAGTFPPYGRGSNSFACNTFPEIWLAESFTSFKSHHLFTPTLTSFVHLHSTPPLYTPDLPDFAVLPHNAFQEYYH